MDPQEPNTWVQPAREREPLTRDVFVLLADFVSARIDPLIAGIRRGADDNTSRALYALHIQVIHYSSARAAFERWRTSDDPDERNRLEQRVCWAWDGLCGLAWSWEDHPDYRADLFGRNHQTMSASD
ncbi:hypothetical protein [Streptomyces sp. NPDC058614]|uniref:hypothetical protein n=1 Tax=Streptomyces sp. NPDC058614 TaxID=3346557 RepID=UPI00365F8AC6